MRYLPIVFSSPPLTGVRAVSYMIRYRTHERAPHLEIELENIISEVDIRQTLEDLPDALPSLPPDFIVLVDYAAVILFEANAIGPLFYYITHVFDADPKICVFVDGKKSPFPGLRHFIEQVGRAGHVSFVRNRSNADERIYSHLRATTRPISC